jgi:hypothetical protein
MARILKPGGRLVITDVDTHAHEWMKAEMAHVWLGFERVQAAYSAAAQGGCGCGDKTGGEENHAAQLFSIENW